LGYEQVFSALEYRSVAASAAECAGLRAERPCLPIYRRSGAESLDLKEITGSYVSGLGQPPFDLRMMVALLTHGYPKRRTTTHYRGGAAQIALGSSCNAPDAR
jgi:hypothetical protein